MPLLVLPSSARAMPRIDRSQERSRDLPAAGACVARAMKPRIDSSRLPVLVVTIEGPPTDEEHARYLEELRELAARGRHVCIVNAIDGGALTGLQRRRQAEWLDRNRAMLDANCAGNAFVFASAIQRFMLSGVLLVTQMPYPYLVVPTLEEAERWAVERLASIRS